MQKLQFHGLEVPIAYVLLKIQMLQNLQRKSIDVLFIDQPFYKNKQLDLHYL